MFDFTLMNMVPIDSGDVYAIFDVDIGDLITLHGLRLVYAKEYDEMYLIPPTRHGANDPDYENCRGAYDFLLGTEEDTNDNTLAMYSALHDVACRSYHDLFLSKPDPLERGKHRKLPIKFEPDPNLKIIDGENPSIEFERMPKEIGFAKEQR